MTYEHVPKNVSSTIAEIPDPAIFQLVKDYLTRFQFMWNCFANISFYLIKCGYVSISYQRIYIFENCVRHETPCND